MIAPKRLLVTGATGFIGRNLVERFAGDPAYAVTGLFHERPALPIPGVAWRQADLRDPAAIASALEDIDIVVHAAATTSGAGDIVRRPSIHVTDNAVMGSYLFRAAHEGGIAHLVFFSCLIMYASSDQPLKETDFDPAVPLEPRYFAAGSTKLYLEQMCRFYAGLGRTRFTAVRHSNIYGPHDKFDLERSHVFGATITKVLEAAGQEMVVWGDGSEARDLLHVDDLIEFVRLALERQPGPFGLYNVGSGKAVTVRSLVEQIIAASGRELAIRYDLAKPTIPTTVALDCGLARRELGWQPAVQLDAGIAGVIAHRRSALAGNGGA